MKFNLWKATYLKGYIGGAPDIQIVSPHKKYNSLSIELTTPSGNGKVSEKQQAYLSNIKIQNHKILVSNDYDTIIMKLHEYF